MACPPRLDQGLLGRALVKLSLGEVGIVTACHNCDPYIYWLVWGLLAIGLPDMCRVPDELLFLLDTWTAQMPVIRDI